MYGGTGNIGAFLSSRLGIIASDLTYPVRDRFLFDDSLKDLRVHGSTGMVYVAHHTDFHDPNNLDRVNRHSDLVINLLGPRAWGSTNYEHFKEINMDIPRKIARSARRTGIKKFIHLSAVGADKHSDSLDFKTKAFGEELIRDEFPEAIILRPTIVISRKDYFLRYWGDQMNNFRYFLPVYDKCTALKQPLIIDDFCEAIVNAIKLENIQGRTFEIGGPFQYTQKELIEIMMNAMNRNIKLYRFNKERAKWLAGMIPFDKFNREDIIKSGIDLTVRQENGEGNIHDLFVQPACVAPFIRAHFEKDKELPAFTKEQNEL